MDVLKMKMLEDIPIKLPTANNYLTLSSNMDAYVEVVGNMGAEDESIYRILLEVSIGNIKDYPKLLFVYTRLREILDPILRSIVEPKIKKICETHSKKSSEISMFLSATRIKLVDKDVIITVEKLGQGCVLEAREQECQLVRAHVCGVI